MNIFKKMFDNKFCNLCGREINRLEIVKVKDGICCKNCISNLSSYFREPTKCTLVEIRYQISCREKNREKMKDFNVTRTIGTDRKVLIDEEKGQFVIASSPNFRNENLDVINCADVINCCIDIQEKCQEIRYEDSNGNRKSFNPPSYAYSYDFYVDITLKNFYIDVLRIKINNRTVDNGQKTLIKFEGGLLGKFTDALLPAKSNKGKSSNAEEVRNCPQYIKYQQIANEMKEMLLGSRTMIKMQKQEKEIKVLCPWCGTKIIPNEQGECPRCCGILE